MLARMAGVLALGALALAAYGSALGAPFFFDDFEAIVSNDSLRGGAVAAAFPPRDTPVAGRPLVNLSFAANHAAGGLEPFGYRLANLVVHVCAALVLWATIALGARRIARLDVLAWQPAPWIVAALWMLHPLQSEAVLYVTQRSESLAGLLYLATLFCAVRALHTRRAGAWAAAAIAVCALGMLTKETMATAPLAVLAFDWVFAPQRMRERARLALYAGLAATWAPLLLLQAAGPRALSAGFAFGDSAPRYLLAQPVVILGYLRAVVWPHPLAIDYGSLRDVAWSAALPCALLLAALACVVAIGLARRRPASYLGAWFFLTLAPSSSIVTIATEIGAERRMYLALAAPIALLVAGAAALASRASAGRARRSVADVPPDARGGPRERSALPRGSALVLTLAACVLLAAELAVTRARARDYRSAVALWTSAVAAVPGNARAHANLGRAYLDAGDDGSAARALDEALRLDPDSAVAHYNLGVLALRRAGDAAAALGASAALEEALLRFERTAALQPAYAAAHNNAGVVLQRLGRRDDALEAFRRGLAARPDDAQLRYNLATALREAGRADEAAAEYARLLDAHPSHASAHNNLGVILADRREYARAAEHFERALELAPDQASTRANLVAALRALGRDAQADAVAAMPAR